MNLTRPTFIASALAGAAIASGAAAGSAQAAEPGVPLLPPTCIGSTTANGACTTYAGATDLDRGGDVVVSPDSRFAYATGIQSTKITIFRYDSGTGALTPAGSIDNDQTAGSLELSADGRHLYAAGTGTGIVRSSIRAYARNEQSGGLGLVGCVAEVTGGSLPGCVSRQGLRGASDVELSPNGDSLYVAARSAGGDANGDGSPDGALTQLSVDPVGGGFTGGHCYPAASTGSGDCSGAAHPALEDVTSVTIPHDGRHVYAAGRRLTVLNRIVSGPDQGAISGSSGTCWYYNDDDGCEPAYGLAGGISDVIASPDGEGVYVTTAGDSAQGIVTFDRDETTGELDPGKCIAAVPLGGSCEPYAPFYGRHIFDVDFSADGRILHLAGGDSMPSNDALLISFHRDPQTNELTPLDCTLGDGQGCAASGAAGTITAFAPSPDGRGLLFRGLHIDGAGGYPGTIGSFPVQPAPVAETPAPGAGDDTQPPTSGGDDAQPPQPQPQPAPPVGDTLAPLLKALKIAKKNVVVGSTITVSGRVSEAGTLELRGMKRKGKRYVATGRAVVVKVAAGSTKVKLSKAQLRRLGASKPGAYRLAVVPIDAAGNRGEQSLVTFSVIKKKRR